MTAFTRIAPFVTVLLAIWSSLAQDARGQDRSASETWLENLEVGGWLGPNVTWFAVADAQGENGTTSRRTGGAAAVEGRVPLVPWMSAVTGLGFATKGAKYEFRSMRSGGFRSGYITVSLLAELAPYRLGQVEPYLLVGPELALMVTCDLDDGFTVGDCKDTSKFIDPGLVVGGGVAVALPWPGRVRLEIRYLHGLLSVDDTEFDQDYKNRAVLFSIGYSHRLGSAARR